MNDDPLLVGLGATNSGSAMLNEDNVEADVAQQFFDQMQQKSASQHETDEPVDNRDPDFPPRNTSHVEIPVGAILTPDGQPFSDFDSADYKAQQMQHQTNDEFIVQALAARTFVVMPQLQQAKLKSAQSHDDAQEEEEFPYKHIPLNELTLKDFPPEHPVHKCGLSRYKRYMKKNFKFKPAYRSMWPLLLMIMFGGACYFYPVIMLNMLPADFVRELVESVPAEKLTAGVSIFGAMLAAFASGKVIWLRIYRRYMLMPAYAKYEEGIIARSTTKIMYANIVNYDVNQSPLGRLLNYGTIELSSAGSDGHELLMHNILAPRLIEVVLESKMDEAKRN